MSFDKLFGMSYEDYADSLIRKYGTVQEPYFTDTYLEEKNSNIVRVSEGLYIHHIDEDKTANLSSAEYIKTKSNASYEYQMPWRLVYCNVVEHLILHMKIVENELSKQREERNQNELIGLGGFMLLVKQIDQDYKFSGKVLPSDYKDCEIKYAEEFEAYWVNVYLQTLGYFLDHIERMDEFWFWYG